MASPALTLNSPADGASLRPDAVVLAFTGTDTDTNGILYNLQLDTADTFDSDGGNPLLDLLSDRNVGFYESAPSANFADPFRANALDTTKWTEAKAGGVTTSYGSGGASITFPSSSTSASTATLTANASVALLNSSISFHLSARPVTSTGATSIFWLWIDANNWIRFSMAGGLIYFQRKYAGTVYSHSAPVTDASFTYKWLRLRSVGTTVSWEISTNGETWTAGYSETATISLNTFTVIVESTCYANESNPGSLTFDSFNIPLIHASASEIHYPLPALTTDTTYYWRVRGKDPNGSNAYGSWSSIQSFTAENPALMLRRFNGSTWDEVAVHHFS